MTTQASTEREALKARKKGRKRLMPVKRKRAIGLSVEDAKVEEEKSNEVIFLAAHKPRYEQTTREFSFLFCRERRTF